MSITGVHGQGQPKKVSQRARARATANAAVQVAASAMQNEETTRKRVDHLERGMDDLIRLSCAQDERIEALEKDAERVRAASIVARLRRLASRWR